MDFNVFNRFKQNLCKLISGLKEFDDIGLVKINNFNLDIIYELEEEANDENSQKIIGIIESIVKKLDVEVSDYIDKLNFLNINKSEDEIKTINNLFNTINNELKRIKYIKILGDKSLVLIGSNGAGKSAFAAYMKESLSDGIIVIPAQKILYYDKTDREIPFFEREQFRKIQNDNFNEKKFFDDVNNTRYYYRMNNLTKLFSALISLTINEYVELITVKQDKHDASNENIDTSTCNYSKFKSIWNKLIPNISWNIDTYTRTLIPCKHNKEYNINDMSDGEKVIIFYILSVLNAEKDSYIIIDEPETYLNPSNYKRIWNLLEDDRNDCTFIYITHNKDFVSTRYVHNFYWCKSYDGDSEWVLEKLDINIGELPKDLLTELLGSQVPILFCEGKTNGLDYNIYSLLFGEIANIIPVGGHQNVIKYTNLYNSINNIYNAFGIIDRDQYSEEKIILNQEKNIFSLYFNEIEMLLLSDEVINDVVNYTVDEKEIKKEMFKAKFFDILKSRKTETINKKIKAIIDEFFELERISEDKCCDFDSIINYLKNKLCELKLNDVKGELEKQLDNIISNENYLEALKICPHKDMIKLAGNTFKLEYKEAAIVRLRENKSLRENIVQKYFNELHKKIIK